MAIDNLNDKYQADLKRLKDERHAQQLAISTNPELINKYKKLQERLHILINEKKNVENEIVALEDVININKCTLCDSLMADRQLAKCKEGHFFCKRHGEYKCNYLVRESCGILCAHHVLTSQYKNGVSYYICKHHKHVKDQYGDDSP